MTNKNKNKNKNFKQMILHVATIFTSLYLTACGGALDKVAQNALYPFEDVNKKYVVPETPPAGYTQVWFDLKDVDNTDIKVHGWVFKNENPKSNTVVYFHGNGENLQSMYESNFLKIMQKMNTNLVLIDYPSYGRSLGATTEYTLVSSAEAAIEYAANTFSDGATFVWGRSIGASVAALAFANTQNLPGVKNLILTSPWNDFISIARELTNLADQIPKEWLSKNTYDSVAAARKIKKSVLIHHGQKDTLVPIKYGRLLAESFAANLVNMVEFTTRGHNDVFLEQQLWQDVTAFVTRVQ